jgi:hypothetical protein
MFSNLFFYTHQYRPDNRPPVITASFFIEIFAYKESDPGFLLMFEDRHIFGFDPAHLADLVYITQPIGNNRYLLPPGELVDIDDQVWQTEG